MYKLPFALLFAALSFTAQAAGVYKCKNPEGVLVYQEQPCAPETQAISSWKSQGGDVESENDELILRPGKGGHFRVDGAINGQFLNFVIDTGASAVTIPMGLANSAGLKCKQFGTMQTANGAAQACSASIQTLSFGGFTLRDVEAIVAPNLNQPLLGMNVLKRFHIEQTDEQMRLKKN